MGVVKVHCGSAHVSGKARTYPYYVASLFQEKLTSDGRKIYINSGKTTTPRRSFKKATRDGLDLAKTNNAKFVEGYGSLHNLPI